MDNLKETTRSFRIFTCLLAAALCSAAVHAQEPPATKAVQAIGTAEIYKDNVATAREQAIQNGLRSAVDGAVLEFLSLDSLIRNFQTTDKILLGNTGSFIAGYKVLAEQRTGQTYRVLMQVSISGSLLEEQFIGAGIISGKKSLPAVLPLFAEQKLDEPAPRYGWLESPYVKSVAETAVAEILTRKGFQILDPSTVSEAAPVEPADGRDELEDMEAVRLGSRLGAELVLLGRSGVEQSSNVMGANIHSFRATVKVRAVRTTNGSEVGTAEQTAVAVSPDPGEGSREALAKAAGLAGEAISRQIAAAGERGFKESMIVRVVVEGTGNLANFVLFRRMLSDISGVESLRIGEMRPDSSTISVKYSGTPRSLADALVVKSAKSFGMNISEVTEEQLRIQLVAK
jgi:hypothetical protein